MNGKRVLLAVVLGLLLALACVTAALAADDPLKVSMELSNNKFSGPETINVSITVSNVGEGDLPGPVTLYYPSGKQVEEFGAPVLSVGVSKNWSGTWKVTQTELDAGKLTFKIKYNVYDDEDVLKNKTKYFSKRIIYTSGAPQITVNRTITPTTAQKDQEVSVTYEIRNEGDVDVSGVTIKENASVSKTTGTIDSIAAGETQKYTFTAKMGTKDMTSSATVSYKAGGKTYTSKVEAATVKYGQVKLSATLTADKKGGAPGDVLKLTLKLKNSGTVDFTDVNVTDEALGTVFSGETVPKGETLTLEKEITITETQDLQFRVTAVNATGEPVETATGRVSVIATDPTQQIVLAVEARADRAEVYRIPGAVRFTVSVRNESAVEVKNITVRAVNQPLYTFESIPAGETRSFSRDTEISMAGSFQFTASCRDQLDQTLTFASNIIPIRHSNPTPVPTEAPLVTPPAPATVPVPTDLNEPEWLDQVETVADTAKYVLGGLAALLLVLLLIGAVRRGKRRSESKKALDHLEGANYRDYSVQPRGRRRSEITGGERKEKPAEAPAAPQEDTAQDGELMAETLKRLYEEPVKAEEPAVVQAPDDETVSRPLPEDETLIRPMPDDETVSRPLPEDETLIRPMPDDETVSKPLPDGPQPVKAKGEAPRSRRKRKG